MRPLPQRPVGVDGGFTQELLTGTTKPIALSSSLSPRDQTPQEFITEARVTRLIDGAVASKATM